MTPNVYLQNVLAGVDELSHGSNNLRGWGSPVAPDPVLLVPRGFDAASQRFLYDVNARFADTRPANSVLRDPFRLVIDVSLESLDGLRPPAAAPRRGAGKGPEGWIRRSADSLAAFYLSNTSDIHKVLMAESDSLFLSAAQMAALRRADSVYSRGSGRFTSRSASSCRGAKAAQARRSWTAWSRRRKSYWKIFWQQPEIADSHHHAGAAGADSADEESVERAAENRKGSQFFFGRPVTLVDTPPRRP